VVEKRLSTISKIIYLQLLIVALVVAVFAMVEDQLYALHSFLGGMAAFIPNVYFALRIKSVQGQEAKKIVRSFYVGESGKLLLTVILFVLIFQIPGIKFIPLMTGYVAVLSIFWFALIIRE
jgi:ATP synthase protein I